LAPRGILLAADAHMSQADELQAQSHDELVAKLGIVAEEADESVFWLKRMLNAKIHSTTVELAPLLPEAEQLARIFGASHRTSKKRRRRGGPR
jgi:hypothetical protein